MIDQNTLKNLFLKSADIVFQEYTFNQSKVLFVTCDAMIDQQMLNNMVIPRIDQFFKNSSNQENESNSKKEIILPESQNTTNKNEEIFDKLFKINSKGSQEKDAKEQIILPDSKNTSGNKNKLNFDELLLPSLKLITDQNEAMTLVYSGNVLLYFEDQQVLYASNIAHKPNRTPEETNMEVIIQGPRDNFIEDLSTNIALIRKRLPTNSLCVEKMKVGKRSKTDIAILYVEDAVNKDILTEIKKQLNTVENDAILSGQSLMEFVNKKNWFLPAFNNTGRPDFAVQSLVRGRFTILVDGVSYGVITPVNLGYLLKSSEDFENTIPFSNFERFLHLIGVTLGIIFPAFWLALTYYHQDQLPLALLATVVVTNRGLPLPAPVEMLLLLTIFELLREAGLRLPQAIGGTVSVVGGIIIGDAAISAGITSPAMIVVIAISTIATFTLPNKSLLTTISVIRIAFVIVTAFFGLFGLLICVYLLILYIGNMRVFGVPYLGISADLSWNTIRKILFRPAKYHYQQRPNMLDPQDESRERQ
ncbi:spore germination protein [Ureibacillus composti]|nr:spore germination protein [Ureibacillus composti]